MSGSEDALQTEGDIRKKERKQKTRVTFFAKIAMLQLFFSRANKILLNNFKVEKIEEIGIP